MLETLLERYHSGKHFMQGARKNGGTRTLGRSRYFNIHRVLKGLEVCLPPALCADEVALTVTHVSTVILP